MIGVIRAIRHIQIKQVLYCPKIYEAIITYEPYNKDYSTEYDESDDIEYQKELMNKLIGKNWFYKNLK